ncbi:hypothetical protein PHMEG_0006997 [Phytophthora megakarya]|uniref:RxLR effector protein n=1 Tax=Phytophthora megakarya TaxID=4795 RepID=A0A225WMH2_9STRA|nr:hypothetical protein PHMEG_0006997 [Phytophthora megakarya]
MLSIRNVQALFGESSGLTTKLTNVHRSDGGVMGVEKNTAVSKMATVLDKNPASPIKLVKDPNMFHVATSLNKQSGKFTKTDVSALHKVFTNNPVKANKFDVAIKFIRKAMIGVVSVGMAALIILTLITLVTAMA